MEAKESLLKIIKTLLEVAIPMPRESLVNFLIGKETRALEEMDLTDAECFGIGENHDEDYWNNVIDMATKAGYLKAKTTKSQKLVLTPQGKKFLKRPTDFEVDEETEEDADANLTEDKRLNELVEIVKKDKIGEQRVTSLRTKQQIKLIQAIDRHIALDDYAESESVDLDDVLTDLEKLVKNGKKLDITYFTNEVIGEEGVNELVNFFHTHNTDSLILADKEFGDVYNEEEIRLARVVYRVRSMA